MARFTAITAFIEVVKPERIVMRHGGHKEGGSGASFVATWTFEALSVKQTRITNRGLFSTPDETREFGAIEGGKQTLARLVEYLDKIVS